VNVKHLVVHGHDLPQQAFSGVPQRLTRSDLGLIDMQSQPYIECVPHLFIEAKAT
jgi:hypothetical protein